MADGTAVDERIASGSVTVVGYEPSVPSQPANMEQTVLEDKDTHPAYMNIMAVATIAVAIIGGLALAGTILLAWNDKTVPEGLPGAVQWALAILGVLLVGDALLGKLAVKA